jgi:hypothetical protein
MFRRLIYLCFLLPCWQFALAGDTSDAAVVSETDISPETEVIIEEEELDAEESAECADAVVAALAEDKTPEELAEMAGLIAKALQEDCQCDQYAVRAMIEIGVPFELAFNSLVETCELEGSEVGELSRSLAPALGGNTGGGPGGGVSP